MSCSARTSLSAVLLVLATASPLAWADNYEPDNSLSNYLPGLLIHGMTQSRDLSGTNDVDYIAVDAVPGHSYEIRFITAGLLQTAVMTRRNNADAQLQEGEKLVYQTGRTSSGVISGSYPHSSSVLTWVEPEADANRSRFIRIESGGFYTATNSSYTIQMRETTLYCPRYNNNDTQATILIMQNSAPQEFTVYGNSCNWTASFYNQLFIGTGHTRAGFTSGSLATADGLAPNGMVVLPTANVLGVGGTKGSIQIAHSCPYGGVQAKAVSLEPATGFTFDTPCAPRP